MNEFQEDALPGVNGAPPNALVVTLTTGDGSPDVGGAGLLAVGCAMTGAALHPWHYVYGNHVETTDGVLRLTGRTRLLVSLIVALPTLDRIALYLGVPGTPAPHPKRPSGLRLRLEDYNTGSEYATAELRNPTAGRFLGFGHIVRRHGGWAFRSARFPEPLTSKAVGDAHGILPGMRSSGTYAGMSSHGS
ncbi:hypothetical protein [Embleya hyalina]|uniref:TerD domain-containing protein n=1 Tax=Embleya hyalina TaxID=516124 RepID=A0A401YQT2_9ACTN|nr:hypothetical protein [Embleya hyalina]GCD96905.1 hypothetical protein EHYA_04592 [Embleya hyalina]